MVVYDLNDIAVYWFIINTKDNDTNGRKIVAWSKDKTLAEFYMEFHKCPNLVMKRMEAPIRDINRIIEDNLMDKIGIENIRTRDPKHPNRSVMVSLPLTTSEKAIIEEEEKTFMSGIISYSELNQMIDYLKDSYQKALTDIFLIDIIDTVVHNRPSKRLLEKVEIDQLHILFTWYSELFG